MRVGLSAYDITAPDLLELARAADEAGFDTLWLGEHLLLPIGYASEHPTTEDGGHQHIKGPIISPDTELVDPLVALAAAAGVTRRLCLATGIYILPLRHPVVTARAAATLQEVSGGRLVLGVGVGWLEEEFTALGIPYETRRARFDEGLEIMRAAWKGGPVEFHGTQYQVGGIQLTARPVEVPVILGGNGPLALARAAVRGDGWFSSGTPSFEDAVRLRDDLGRLRAEHGLDGPYRRYFRVAGADPDVLARYADAGFEDVVVWADQLWPAEGTVAEKRDSFLAAAEKLGPVS